MALQPFRFKQFSVAHDRCTHKVGTDAVLLGSWVNISETDRHILDVGTGSGVIALMLAQRTGERTLIDAIDIHPHDADQARENAANSPWPGKINVHLASAQNFTSENRYDLIVSNPPYFSKSLLPPDSKRSAARHTGDLSFEDLLQTVVRLLAPDGRVAVILPLAEASHFTDLAAGVSLYPFRRTNFRTRVHKPVERVLLELSMQRMVATTSDLTLYNSGDEWSDAHRELTRDFYIRP